MSIECEQGAILELTGIQVGHKQRTLSTVFILAIDHRRSSSTLMLLFTRSVPTGSPVELKTLKMPLVRRGRSGHHISIVARTLVSVPFVMDCSREGPSLTQVHRNSYYRLSTYLGFCERIRLPYPVPPTMTRTTMCVV